jgi:hypothetical protein
VNPPSKTDTRPSHCSSAGIKRSRFFHVDVERQQFIEYSYEELPQCCLLCAVSPGTEIERTDAWKSMRRRPVKGRGVSNKQVLSRTCEVHTRTIAGKKDVGAAAAEDTIPIGMHLKEIFSSMQAIDRPIVFRFLLFRSNIIKIGLILGSEDRLDLAHLKPVFGIEMQSVAACQTAF